MNEQEAFKLLTLASARDGRTVTQSVAKVWAGDLERVYFEDAVEALAAKTFAEVRVSAGAAGVEAAARKPVNRPLARR